MSTKEYYRLSCYSSGRMVNFPHAISGGLESHVTFKERGIRDKSGQDADTFLIPARAYSRELHAELVKMNESQVNGNELYIEHGMKDGRKFRPSSVNPVAIGVMRGDLLPRESELAKGKTLIERFFSSRTGFAITTGTIIAGSGALYFCALKERQAPQAAAPQPAATVNEIAKQDEVPQR